jgi:hypothetical protein
MPSCACQWSQKALGALECGSKELMEYNADPQKIFLPGWHWLWILKSVGEEFPDWEGEW